MGTGVYSTVYRNDAISSAFLRDYDERPTKAREKKSLILANEARFAGTTHVDYRDEAYVASLNAPMTETLVSEKKVERFRKKKKKRITRRLLSATCNRLIIAVRRKIDSRGVFLSVAGIC